MRILDRHIITSIAKTFALTLLVFCMLYILIDATSNLDEIIGRRIPLNVLIQYYLASLPVFLVQNFCVTFACLIAVLLTFGAMNNNNEIVSMRSSGLNFWQITRPALCFGLLVSVTVFGVNEVYIPKADTLTQQIRNENMILMVDRMRKKKETIKNLTFYGLKNRLYFIDTFIAYNDELDGITIIEYDENQNIRQKIVALKGKWTRIAWKFYQCQITTYNPVNMTTPRKIKIYKEKLMDIKETPEDFVKQRLNVSSMNIKQLKEYISRFSNSGALKAINSLRVDLHQRMAFPFGNFVIVLIGLPFALMFKTRKGATFTSLGLAICIGFLYYITNAVSLAFGKGGFFPPFVSAWTAPLFFSIIALAVIKTDFSN
jgi:lipopolysaccharide export system permease protein